MPVMLTVCWRGQVLTSLADSQHNQYDKYLLLCIQCWDFWWWTVDLSETCRVLYLILTHSTVHSPSWEGGPFPSGSPTKTLYTALSSQIHTNIIHPSTPRSPQWSLSLRFPHQDPIHCPLLTHTRHMPNSSHFSGLYHPHNIGWGVQIT